MGSGKSAVGSIVALRAGARFHDLDRMIEDEARMPVADIFSSKGEAAFRTWEREILPRALEPGAVVALGGGAVMDDVNWDLVSARSIPLYLEVPFETIWQRIRANPSRPLIAGRTQADVEALFEARRRRYQQAAHSVDGDRPIEVVADEVLKLWSA